MDKELQDFLDRHPEFEKMAKRGAKKKKTPRKEFTLEDAKKIEHPVLREVLCKALEGES